MLAIWAMAHFSKPNDLTTAESLAEKMGRENRERMARQNQPPPTETATVEPPIAPPAAVAPDSFAEKAKLRVKAMLEAWRNNKSGSGIWAGYESAYGTDKAVEEGFKKFLSQRPLPDKFNYIEFKSADHLDLEKYTRVEVALDGIVYQMGVPDGGKPIFWI